MAASHCEQVTVYALDVGEHAQIERLAQSLSDESIDLLINNASIYTASSAGDFGNADYEAWMRTFRITTLAPLKMMQTFTPQIIRRSQETTVTIGSKIGSIADNTSGHSYITGQARRPET